MFYSYYTLTILDLFIAIQGRNGPADNPDMMLGIVVILFGVLMAGLIIPTIFMFKRSALVMLGFLVVFVAFGIVMATNVGFPYRHAVSPKRFWIFVRLGVSMEIRYGQLIFIHYSIRKEHSVTLMGVSDTLIRDII